MEQANQDIQRQNELLESLSTPRRRQSDLSSTMVAYSKSDQGLLAAAWMLSEAIKTLESKIPARGDFLDNPGQFLGETEAELRQATRVMSTAEAGPKLAKAVMLIFQAAAANSLDIASCLRRSIATAESEAN